MNPSPQTVDLSERFRQAILTEIAQNGDKGDWDRWELDFERLRRESQKHLNQLLSAVSRKQLEKIREFSADLGAIAMKMYSTAISQIDPKAPVPELIGTYPVCLYFESGKDRDEFIQMVQEAKPNLVAKKLD